MARIQLKVWQAPLSVLSSPPPVGLSEGELGIVLETNTFVRRPDGDSFAPLISLGSDSNFVRPRAATTNHIELSDLQTIDGVFLNPGDIVLVKDQNDARLNGIYLASIGQWTRYFRADNTQTLATSIIAVEAGVKNGDTLWVCNVNRDAGPIGTVDILFKMPAGSAHDETPPGTPGGAAVLGEDGTLSADYLPKGPGGVLLTDVNDKVSPNHLPSGPGGALLTDSSNLVPVNQLPVGPGAIILSDEAGKLPVSALKTNEVGGLPLIGQDGMLSHTVLPVATITQRGAVRAGSGVTIDANGVLSVTLEPGVGQVGEDGKFNPALLPAAVPGSTAGAVGIRSVEDGSDFGLDESSNLIVISKDKPNGLAGIGPDGNISIDILPNSFVEYNTLSELPPTGKFGVTYVTNDGTFFWNGTTYRSLTKVIDGGTF